jgi:hypothetical protein
MEEKCKNGTVSNLNISKIDGVKNLIDDYRKLMGSGLIEEIELFVNDKEESLEPNSWKGEIAKSSPFRASEFEMFKSSIKGCIELVANGLIKEFGLEHDNEESLEGEITRLSFLSPIKIKELWKDLTEEDPQPDAPMQELIEDIAHFMYYGEPVALSDNGRSIRSQCAKNGECTSNL